MKLKTKIVGLVLLLLICGGGFLSSCFLLPRNTKVMTSKVTAITPLCELEVDFELEQEVTKEMARDLIQQQNLPITCGIRISIGSCHYACPTPQQAMLLLVGGNHECIQNCTQKESKENENDTKQISDGETAAIEISDSSARINY